MESLPSYTQTLKSQQDTKQSKAKFQLQIIIQTNFLFFHEELQGEKNLIRAKLQQTYTKFEQSNTFVLAWCFTETKET